MSSDRDQPPRRLREERCERPAKSFDHLLGGELWSLHKAFNAGVELAAFDQIEHFSAPPSELVAEGRFNHAGHRMLYLANSANSALREIAERDGGATNNCVDKVSTINVHGRSTRQLTSAWEQIC